MLGLGIMLPQVNKVSAGFSPNELGELFYYIDANNTTGWTISVNRVATAINRGLQSSYNFSQNSAGNQPTLVTSGGSNNKAYLNFDSSNSAVLFASDDGETQNDVPLGDYYTIFAVTRLDTTTNGNYGISSMRKTGLNRFMFRQVLGGVDQLQLSNWDSSGLVTDGTADTTQAETWVITVGKVYDDGGTTKVEAFINNASNGSQTISNALADDNCILNIGKGNVGGQFYDGFISEFGLYNKALTTGQQQRLTKYLSFKYGISI